MVNLVQKIKSLSLDRQLQKLCQKEEFKEFENRLKETFGIEYHTEKYPSVFDYVSALFLVDMLDNNFKEANIELPEHLNVLDIGAGRWSYVNALHNFLSNFQGKREVRLTGIDPLATEYKKKVKKMITSFPAEYLPLDIRDMTGSEIYDCVIMAHMIRSRSQFKSFKVKPITPAEIFQKGTNLMKKEGTFVGIAHEYAGESGIFYEFPQEKIIHRKSYTKKVGNEFYNFIASYHTFNDNVIAIAKK